MKTFLPLLFLAALVSSSILPGTDHKDESDVENTPVLHGGKPSYTYHSRLLNAILPSSPNLHHTIDSPSTANSRSVSALDAEGFFDENPDTSTASVSAKARVTVPIEIYKMCKREKDCPDAWFCFDGRCVHPEIEEMRKRAGYRVHPLFERARRLFY